MMERNGGGEGGKSGNLPTKPYNWLGKLRVNKCDLEGNNGDGDVSNSQPPASIEVFRKRVQGGGEIMIGIHYQADIPDMIPVQDRNVQAENDRALLVWRPTEKLSEYQFDQYICMAKKFHQSLEQALVSLHYYQYVIPKATKDLAISSPSPDHWSEVDKVLFEQAFQIHGKHFDKIKQYFPEKPMSSLIQYYYNWKGKKSSQEDEDSTEDKEPMEVVNDIARPQPK